MGARRSERHAAQPGEGQSAHFELHKKEKLSGSTGCNNFTGSYIASQGALQFTPGATTMKMCVPAVAQQEQAFLAALKATTAYKVMRYDAGVDERGPGAGEVSGGVEAVKFTLTRRHRPMLRSIAIVIGCYVLSIVLVLGTDPLLSRLFPGDFVHGRIPSNGALLASTACFVVRLHLLCVALRPLCSGPRRAACALVLFWAR